MFKILVTFRISSSIHTKKEKRNCLVEYIKVEVSSAPKLYINNGKVKCMKQSLSFKQRTGDRRSKDEKMETRQ